MRQHLLIDADDTLWENNIYFERAFHAFCEFLDHSSLTPAQIRQFLDGIELINIQVNGYGARNFGRNMVECFHQLAEREVSSADADYVTSLAERILEHPLEIIAGVPETLEYLAARHDLLLVTKGDPHEQRAKVDASGLSRHFREVIVVREKDRGAYCRVVADHRLDAGLSWMIGNSPKSDINPALEAGLGAVYVPHPRTWHLEHQEVAESTRLHVVTGFPELQRLF
ncbi:MAG: HAD family hydrolase [Bryobacterales bacterium]|nr:HAD family hydrolase [Bryobacterales bacterium]